MDVKTVVRLVAARLHALATPIILEYELTHFCNLACRYCNRHTAAPDELEHDDIFRVLGEFHRLGMRFIGLDGGEPLTHPHFAEIVDWLVDQGVTVHLNSNGILVPRRIETVKKVAQLKISLDGAPERHDAMRGENAFRRAIRGTLVAREAGIPVELRCVIGSHNWDGVDQLIDLVEELNAGLVVLFQPARESLFTDTPRDGGGWMTANDNIARAFGRVEARKRAGSAVANRWGSLRHFREFPRDVTLPCPAGWITASMDPTGRLHHCGMVRRDPNSPNARDLGAAAAFAAIPRQGCEQCWCARAVEGNQAWAGRFLQLNMPLRVEA